MFILPPHRLDFILMWSILFKLIPGICKPSWNDTILKCTLTCPIKRLAPPPSSPKIFGVCPLIILKFYGFISDKSMLYAVFLCQIQQTLFSSNILIVLSCDWKCLNTACRRRYSIFVYKINSDKGFFCKKVKRTLSNKSKMIEH